ncbi:hypothetical protein [Nocardioides humi]|uniref:Uncharacterized protein n=1 Tax=Nocardioides humi TaxID=449461 RepID=A0ABN2BPD0_9ACTN|nr:hypothetical protein [Nocardioides humi]
MNNNDTWEPVALIPATLSDENNTTVEVVQTRGGIYLLAMEPNSDTAARDCCMTEGEARRLALAILATVGPEPARATSKPDSECQPDATVAHLPSARRGRKYAGTPAYLQAAA